MSTRIGHVPPPGTDFYYPTADKLPGEAGEIIWHRTLPSDHRAVVKPLEPGAQPWHHELVLYRSRDIRGNPIGVSGIIALPNAPAEGYPVISWAHGTVGCADRCAPSRDEEPLSQPHNAYVHRLLREFLNQGWAVVMTDYEGLGTAGTHPYLLGESEARGILDIVLAARQLYPTKIGTRFQIVGHSQGGQAALFGAHHAPDWTDLKLCGVTAVAPASAIGALVTASVVNPVADKGNAFTALFIAGAVAGDPSIDLAELLTDKAYPLYEHVGDRARAGLANETDSWGSLTGREQFRVAGSPSKEKFSEQIRRMHPNLDIGVPIRIAQAQQDIRIKAFLTTELVEQLRTKNGKERVDYDLYMEDDNVPETDLPDELGIHFGTIEKDIPKMIPWLAERFKENQ